MAIDLQPVLDAAAAAVNAVWPETVANGIHLTGHASSIPFSERILPFATLVLGPFLPADGWGAGTLKEQGPFQLWYTDETGSDASKLNPKLAAMQAYLNKNRVFGAGVLIDLPASASFSEQLEPNVLWGLTGQTQRAGMVGSTILVYDDAQ